MKDQRGSLRLPKGRRRVAGVTVLLAVTAVAAAAIAHQFEHANSG